MNVFKPHINRINDKTGVAYSAPYHAGPTTRQSTVPEISQVLLEKFMKPATTRWAVPIVLTVMKDG